MFFFSGLHSDYHKPSDTWDKINAPSAARLLDLVENVAVQLANATEAARVPGCGRRQADHRRRGRRLRAVLRLDSRFRADGKRREVFRCKAELSGCQGGTQSGDILIQFGDKPIKNLYDFTDALRRSKVGDVVEVKVLRDGQPITASVKLEQRK